MTRTINGIPYSVTRNAYGWGVVSLESCTDRLHRAYQVQVNADGSPRICSCPDCFYRGHWCKHLSAVALMIEEETLAPLDSLPSWSPSTTQEGD